MKKLILLSLFVFAASISKAVIVIVKSGGGANGYRDVTEVHANGNHELQCRNPGYALCKWDIKPTVVQNPNTGNYCQVDVDFIEAAVSSYIAGGQSSGTETMSNGVIFSWTSSGNDVEITIRCNN